MNFSLVEPYLALFWRGFGTTVQVTGLSLVLAFVLGALIAVLKVIPNKPLNLICRFYTSIFRGVPLIVLLFLAYFATPQLTGYKISGLMASVLTLGLNGSATISEVLRGGIEGVDAGQYDAARALGMAHIPMMRLIIIPQALRSVAPALVNEAITILKSSSLVAVIGVADLMRAAQSVQALTYRAFEPFILSAIIYYVIVMALSAFGRFLERRMAQSDGRMQR